MSVLKQGQIYSISEIGGYIEIYGSIGLRTYKCSKNTAISLYLREATHYL